MKTLGLGESEDAGVLAMLERSTPWVPLGDRYRRNSLILLPRETIVEWSLRDGSRLRYGRYATNGWFRAHLSLGLLCSRVFCVCVFRLRELAMNSFFDLEEGRPVPLQAFLDGLQGLKRDRVAAMLGFANHVLRLIHRGSESSDDLPDIRIADDDQLFAGHLVNYIQVTKGLVDHCLSVDFAPIDSVVETRHVFVGFPYESIAADGMAWILAHEYFHGLRRHWLFDDDRSQRTREVSLATERDADLCAVAAIYRVKQLLFPGVDDDCLRQLTLYSIFWSVRSLPQSGTEGTHLPIGVRLRDMAEKLAILNENPRDLPDPSAAQPATIQRAKLLHSCLMKCEQAYLLRHPSDEPLSDELHYAPSDCTVREVIGTWESIRHKVDGDS